jgi:hypothetical protein
MAGRKKKAKEGTEGTATDDKAAAALAAASAGIVLTKPGEFAEALAIANASDEEVASIEHLPGDRWDGNKLMERVINADLTEEADVPIPLADYQARSERMATATEQLLDILPREKATMLATFRERKAVLEQECDRLRKEVQHHTERRLVPIEQIAVYDPGDGSGGLMIWRMKEGERKIIRQRPLDTEEKQMGLPLHQRTKKFEPKNPEPKDKGSKSGEPVPEEPAAETTTPVVDPNNDPNAPPFGSMAWTRIPELPGLTCLPGDREVYRLAFKRRINLKMSETEGKDGVLTGDEIKEVMDIVIADLAKDESRLRADVAKQTAEADAPDVRKYQEDPENPGRCKLCSGDPLFGHEPDFTCKVKLRAV